MLKKLGLNKLNKMMTIADKIIILFILLVSVTLLFLTPQVISNDSSKQVVITLKDKEIYRYDLTNNQQVKRIKFEFEINQKEYQGVLRIKNGKVKLERLNQDISPLPIHAEMGWISKSYQMILCMPIELAVTIEDSDNSEQDIDAMSY